MKKILIVVDMQNDFITGVLSNDETKAILPRVAEKIREHGAEYDCIYLTQDTHFTNYGRTIEGQRIPLHCFVGEEGNGRAFCSEITEALNDLTSNHNDIKIEEWMKETFGCQRMIDNLLYHYDKTNEMREFNDRFEYEFELCGVCTDICVISNAMLLRNAFPNAIIKVDASCCAGTSKEVHQAALTVMSSCLIDVID